METRLKIDRNDGVALDLSPGSIVKLDKPVDRSVRAIILALVRAIAIYSTFSTRPVERSYRVKSSYSRFYRAKRNALDSPPRDSGRRGEKKKEENRIG